MARQPPRTGAGRQATRLRCWPAAPDSLCRCRRRNGLRQGGAGPRERHLHHLDRDVLDLEAVVQLVGGVLQEGIVGMALAASPGARSSRSRDVPMAQTCRSCTRATPGSDSSSACTACRSTPSGTPSNSRCSDCLNRLQVPTTMTAAISRLTTGSSQVQPNHSARPPATTTPAETSASAAMCRKAPRMLRSVSRAAHEQQRGGGVDDDADAGHHHDGDALDGLRRLQAVHGLPGQRAHRHQQQQRVDEGRQDAGALPAVGVARVGPQSAGQRAAPGQHQADHVAEVVAGVGQQGQRVDLPAVEGLDRDEGDVQRDADGEGAR